MPNYSPKFGDTVLHNGFSKIYMGDQSGWLTLGNPDGSRDLVLPSDVDLNGPQESKVAPTVPLVTVQAPSVPSVTVVSPTTPEVTVVTPKAVKVPRYRKEAI